MHHKKPRPAGGNSVRQDQGGFERALQKNTRMVICSTPYTERVVQVVIGFDKVLANIGRDYATGKINGLQHAEAMRRADNAARMLEAEMHTIRNQARPRKRQNQPVAKPRVLQMQKPAAAPTAGGATPIPTPAPATAPTAIDTKAEAPAPKAARGGKKKAASA